MTSIPSEEDFARADREEREDSRNLDTVCANVTHHFKSLCPLHNVYILPQGDVDFRVYVFFNEDNDIEACRRSGVLQGIVDLVYEELERAGRGRRADITVAFEFDSDENVTANFEGDYFLRLR